MQGYNYTTSVLTNILTKREYLFREYFLTKGSSVNLPAYALASPTNSLLSELKHSYSYIDPTSFISEVQRDLFYENLVVNRFSVLIDAINFINFTSALGYPQPLTNAITYVFNLDFTDRIGRNAELYQNQFRPMRKGISNMIRLQATGAVTLPSEIRLNILASSRDIIHS